MHVSVGFGGPVKGAKQDRQKQQKHTCGVSKGDKQDRQKQQYHISGVSKGLV
jgi:hypothetical protein